MGSAALLMLLFMPLLTASLTCFQRWVRSVSVSGAGAVKAALLEMLRADHAQRLPAAPSSLCSRRVWHAWIDAAVAMQQDRYVPLECAWCERVREQ
jgi:hypothetical protein